MMEHKVLKLEGNAAAVMMIAKLGLSKVAGSDLDRLKAGIATMAGLSNAADVRLGDVLRIVAGLHDDLTDAKLLCRPAQSMIDSLVGAYVMGAPKEEATELLLNCMMSNIRNMRIRSEAGRQLVNWEGQLPTGFMDNAVRLCEERLEREAEAV